MVRPRLLIQATYTGNSGLEEVSLQILGIRLDMCILVTFFIAIINYLA